MMTIMNLLTMVMNFAKGFTKKEEGQGMVEYALIIALIAIIVIVALLVLGPRIAQIFTDISNEL